jgi:hypothetical protein
MHACTWDGETCAIMETGWRVDADKDDGSSGISNVRRRGPLTAIWLGASTAPHCARCTHDRLARPLAHRHGPAYVDDTSKLGGPRCRGVCRCCCRQGKDAAELAGPASVHGAPTADTPDHLRLPRPAPPRATRHYNRTQEQCNAVACKVVALLGSFFVPACPILVVFGHVSCCHCRVHVRPE